MTGYVLSWQLNRRRPISENLAGALARHRERCGREATTITTAPGEAFAAAGLVVSESRRVRPGCWDLGGGE